MIANHLYKYPFLRFDHFNGHCTIISISTYRIDGFKWIDGVIALFEWNFSPELFLLYLSCACRVTNTDLLCAFEYMVYIVLVFNFTIHIKTHFNKGLSSTSSSKISNDDNVKPLSECKALDKQYNNASKYRDANKSRAYDMRWLWP